MNLKMKTGVAALGAAACFLLFQNCGSMSGFSAIKSASTVGSTGGNSGTDTTGGSTGSPTGTSTPVIIPDPVATGISAILKWDLPAASQATGFIIESSTDGINFSTIAQTAATARSFKALGLTRGSQYTFRIRTKNAVAESESIIQQIQVPVQ